MIGQYVTISGDVISHVNISAVKTEDGGEYECTARSRAGQNSHSARLNIYGMPYVRSMSPISAVAGKLLQIKCPVAGYPIDKIIWEKSECGYTFRIRVNRPLIGLWFPFFPFFLSPFSLWHVKITSSYPQICDSVSRMAHWPLKTSSDRVTRAHTRARPRISTITHLRNQWRLKFWVSSLLSASRDLMLRITFHILPKMESEKCSIARNEKHIHFWDIKRYTKELMIRKFVAIEGAI